MITILRLLTMFMAAGRKYCQASSGVMLKAPLPPANVRKIIYCASSKVALKTGSEC